MMPVSYISVREGRWWECISGEGCGVVVGSLTWEAVRSVSYEGVCGMGSVKVCQWGGGVEGGWVGKWRIALP